MSAGPVIIRPIQRFDVSMAWLAGLLEGEGHFSHRKVELEMTDRDVVERASQYFPGPRAKVCRRDRSTRPGHERARPTYRYRWHGRPALQLMEAVLPYMGERRHAKIQGLLTKGHA